MHEALAKARASRKSCADRWGGNWWWCVRKEGKITVRRVANVCVSHQNGWKGAQRCKRKEKSNSQRFGGKRSVGRPGMFLPWGRRVPVMLAERLESVRERKRGRPRLVVRGVAWFAPFPAEPANL